jgi:hypothetical protein
MIRKLGSAGLALSVLFALLSLVLKGGVGLGWADGLVDFNLTSAKIEITHETANECLSPPGSFISCGGYDSDSYEILANLALSDTAEFESRLNESIFVSLSAGTCGDVGLNESSPTGTWTGIIPGASLHKVTNKNFTIYNFAGNVPTISSGYDGVQFNLKIPTKGTPTLALSGNANLCQITGPMSLQISFDSFCIDRIDCPCVDIPAPQFGTLDVSSAACIELAP